MSVAKQWDREALEQAIYDMWVYRKRFGIRSGKHMKPVEDLLSDYIFGINGAAALQIKTGRAARLPGFYRPRKDWDLVVMDGKRLLVAIEAKSQGVEKIGNNTNNRNEEAVGSATDLRLVYQAGRVGEPLEGWAPWLGYLFILEAAPAATDPASQAVTNLFELDPAYGKYPSYARRYQVLCQRLLETDLYDGACFLLSPQAPERGITEVNPEIGDSGADITFSGFLQSMAGSLEKYLANRQGPALSDRHAQQLLL
ncbi:PaeR7I family type II restriction endonuclease [Streptomyces sp. NPDC004596]|uniref:PaeR7I family type II restriction endonuclease n=1 Tax=Streptomyces sp. DSM 118148 TaxID=3448667 RepID=UPI0040403CA3